MKNLFFTTYLLLLLTFFENTKAAINNKIALKIENKIITQYEIKNKILRSLILSEQEINQKNIDALKKKSLNSLIQLTLKRIELEKYNFKADNLQLNKYLQSISSNNVDGLKQKFKNNNLDFNLFKEEIVTELKWQRLIYEIYSKKILINESVIDIELKNIIANKAFIEEYHLSEIEIEIENRDINQAQLIEILEKIKNEGFEVAALKYSISDSAQNKGDIGWINSNSLSDDIYNKISKLKSGEISDPIKRQSSFLILKVNDKRKLDSDINEKELKASLINQKKNELFNLYSRSHLSKLKNTSLIEYK
tara:strand:- start:695 stop:1618 length:924 start_codon:yes stop_codon:yes gene_type:complete